MVELYEIKEPKERAGPCGSIADAITHSEEYLREHFGPAAKAEARYGTLTEEEIKETATINGIISVVGCIIQWEIDRARRIAHDILEDVNDHTCAALVEETLKRCR